MGRLLTTAKEYLFIQEIKQYGVLRKTNSSIIDLYRKFPVGEHCCGDIYAGCPDMDVLFNKFEFHFASFGRKLHPCATVHGGGSGLHPKSPLNAQVPFPTDYFCHHIMLGGSVEVKNTRRLVIYDHMGCGAARLGQLSPPQQIELNLLSRGFFEESLRDRGKDFEVVPLLYAYYGIPGDEQHFDSHTEETFVIDNAAWFDTREKWVSDLMKLPIRLAEPATMG